MSFCKFSSEFVASSRTQVDNLFINDFLPHAPAECIKVYLYGLYKCSNAESYDNTIESFSKVLKMSESDIESCFLYWQEQGLVQVLPTIPVEIRFIPTSSALGGGKKFNKKKYENFNIQAQEILSGRMITPSEFAEYYTLLEVFKMEEEALLMIMHYCLSLKGKDVGYKYILTVAKNWAYEGILTSKQVEEKLKIMEALTSTVTEILKTLGLKHIASIEEKELLKKWTEALGFSFDVIKFAAKELKSRPGPSMKKLDVKLMKYYEAQLFSLAEIEAYEKQKEEFFKTAKTVNKAMGLYYENLETVVDNYVSKWYGLGFSGKTLALVASYAFKSSIRTLEGMDVVISKLYKLGLVSERSINEYLEALVTADKKIKSMLESLGLFRLVTQTDREFYKTWKEHWRLSDELISYGISIAAGKLGPMNYLNKILSNWFENKIMTLEEAKTSKPPEGDKAGKQTAGRSYTREELNSLFSSIEEIEI